MSRSKLAEKRRNALALCGLLVSEARIAEVIQNAHATQSESPVAISLALDLHAAALNRIVVQLASLSELDSPVPYVLTEKGKGIST